MLLHMILAEQGIELSIAADFAAKIRETACREVTWFAHHSPGS